MKFFLPILALFAMAGPTWGGIKITAAGATFPRPIYSKWIARYQNETDGKVLINYQAIGSSGGIRQLVRQTVDFAASDAPMGPKDQQKVPWKIRHIPTVLGAITLAYNLPGVKGLRLDGPTVAKIFMARITKWNDPQIVAMNQDIDLPDKDILPVRRADGSGSTWVFSDYLSKVSPLWNQEMGRAKSLRWPGVTVGARGNDGVTGVVRRASGAIGYVELSYAIENDLPVAKIKNWLGNFIAPSVESISAASASVGDKIERATSSITNSHEPNAYPISAFTYILLPLNGPSKVKLSEIRNFLKWALTKGQDMAPELHYAPLSPALSRALIKSL